MGNKQKVLNYSDQTEPLFLDNRTKNWTKKYNSKHIREIREKILVAYKDLFFDEGPHIYTIDDKPIPSVSSMVEKFVKPFPAEEMSVKCSNAYFNDPDSRYYRMTPEEIAKSWEENATEAAKRGTFAHEFGESCMHYMVGDYDEILPTFKNRLTPDGLFVSHGGFEDAIVKFWNDMPEKYVPVLAETKVFASCGLDRPLYAGTFDLLVYSTLPKHPGLIIFDYKTNKNLYNNYRGQRMLHCLNSLLDCDKNHYEVQQCLYENALNEIGLDILAKRLVWIKETGEYEAVRLTEDIKGLVVESLSKNIL